MKRYRISRVTANGAVVTTTTELNPAAVVKYLENGYAVAYVGPSLVTVVPEPCTRAEEEDAAWTAYAAARTTHPRNR